MCSICGEVNFTEINDKRADIVKKMNSIMKHRGPDDSGIFSDENVCLCHNRLSIMDPKNGHQPMSIIYGNKKYTIIYNGEIYNVDEIKKDLKKLFVL